MKRVLIIHGFEGSPNGGWRPWLMGELGRKNIYAAALAMPTPEKPVLAEWLAEVARHVERSSGDEIYLVGHSLGVATILRYLSGTSARVAGAVLVSGPCEPVENEKISEFLAAPFDFATIKARIGKCAIIHGDNDAVVPLAQAQKLSRALDAKLIVIKNGQHLNGSAGWYQLPECRDSLLTMLNQ